MVLLALHQRVERNPRGLLHCPSRTPGTLTRHQAGNVGGPIREAGLSELVVGAAGDERVLSPHELHHLAPERLAAHPQLVPEHLPRGTRGVESLAAAGLRARRRGAAGFERTSCAGQAARCQSPR